MKKVGVGEYCGLTESDLETARQLTQRTSDSFAAYIHRRMRRSRLHYLEKLLKTEYNEYHW
ncbi:hypothetical protein F2Q68_00026208 [Brassica cretica]|uniref:Uncharacterized protein n=1 Tax=Brassica cretica TaxID=69181 RepID=A0A8S9IJH0_BRACR|nr:hypothetical protein F2Q68_00026208 [Brassica cretica]